MSFDAQLLSLMNSTIRVSTRTAHNNYGEPSFGSSTATYRARIVEKPGFITGKEGETIAYSHTIWARSTGSVSITVTDRITLPDGSTPPVVAVERYPDSDGPNHVKIHLGH